MIFIIIVAALLLAIGLWYDYNGPSQIPLFQTTVFKLKCLRARNLVVQEIDKDGNIYATRGLILYRLNRGDGSFRKVTRVPDTFSLYFLNNFTLFRRLTLRQECVELTISHDGSICAFSSGKMWYREGSSDRFRETMSLEHFGRGVGRGLMSTGLVSPGKNEFLFGEYFRNDKRNEVKIYMFGNTGKSWECAYEFLKGQIKHIHAVQKDPYTGKIWVCTGDEDPESGIGWIDPESGNLVYIGQGSQAWRTCQLVFTEKSVYWGADTGHALMSGIYKWNRVTGGVSRLAGIEGGILFATRLENGSILMSTDREGFPNEKDDLTRLIIIGKDDMISTWDCGTWNYKKKGLRFNFAKLRFQRNQDAPMLAVSCLNQKEIPDGDLLIFSGETIGQAQINSVIAAPEA